MGLGDKYRKSGPGIVRFSLMTCFMTRFAQSQRSMIRIFYAHSDNISDIMEMGDNGYGTDIVTRIGAGYFKDA